MIYAISNETSDISELRKMNLYGKDKLYNLLFSNDDRLRTFAAQTIQVKYPTRESLQKGINLVKLNNPAFREIGAFLLGQLGTPKTPFSSEIFNILESLLDDENHEVLSATICALGHLGARTGLISNAKLIDKILAHSVHKEADVRSCVAFALSGCINNNKTTKILNFLKNDKDEDVAEWAQITLETRSLSDS